MNTKLIVSSAALSALLIAAPAYADQEKGGHRIGLSAFMKALEHKNEKHDDKDTRATSTVAVHGTVSAVNGSVITLTGKNAAIYTVQASQAEVKGGVFADIVVGDKVTVKGTVSGTVIVATKIQEIEKGKMHDAKKKLGDIHAGIVTAIGPSGFTIARFGTGTTTVDTNASTTMWAVGQGSTTSVAVGSRVIVAGATTTSDSIVANVVLIFNKGLGWMKHWLDR